MDNSYEEKAVVDYLKNKISDDAFAKILFPYIAKISKIVASKFSIDPDDLTQELWLIFSSKLIYEYDQVNSLSAFVFGYAKNCAFGLYKDNSKAVNFTSFMAKVSGEADADELDVVDSIINHAGATKTHYEMDEDSILAKIRSENLKKMSMSDAETLSKIPSIEEELNRTPFMRVNLIKALIENDVILDKEIGSIISTVQSIEEINNSKNSSGSSRNISNFTEDHISIRNSRLKLKKTIPQFAHDLGISTSSLISYEYGRTRRVPSDVMDRVRQFELNFTDSFLDIRNKFNKFSMSDIVIYWAKKAKIPISDRDALASLFSVSRVTIRRWLLNENMADIEKISEIDKMIDRRFASVT